MSDDAAFLRSEFAELGSARQVSRALRALVDGGELVRVGVGLYAKARRSALSGRPIPADQLIEIGLQVMRKRGIRADVGRAARAYRDGKTTQMPMRCVMAVWGSRTAIKIGFRGRQIEYEYDEER